MIKSKDMTVLVILVSLSALLSYLISNTLFSSKKLLTTKVELVDKVASDFSYEDKSYFTNNPLNPTKNITISQNNNKDPLSSK